MKPVLRSTWKFYRRNKVAGMGGALESRDGENERKCREQGPWLGSCTFSVPLAQACDFLVDGPRSGTPWSAGCGGGGGRGNSS